MSDLISREEAIGVLETMTEIEEGIEMMYALPSIEAKPVVHGEWLPTRDSNKKECSNCGVIHLIAQYPHGQANYCPNCGAKMDGGDQNE